MAIQLRRGAYEDFDPEKLVEGELAVVLSGDPGSSTGRSLYVCFGSGVVKRIADYEDAADMIDVATEDVQAAFLAAINQAISNAGSAATTATAAAESADTAASGANSAAGAANSAASAANTAAEAATAAAAGDISNKTVTFTEADESEKEIESPETTATMFGKIKRWLSDLKDAAFQSVANNLTTSASGYVLDARQGRALNTSIQNLQAYKSGEQIDIRWGCYAGYLASSGKGLYFSIPLQKPITSGVTISFAHFMAVIRHSDGGYMKGSTPTALAEYGTVDYYLSDTAIFVRVTMSTASTFTNLAPIVVYASVDSYLALS